MTCPECRHQIPEDTTTRRHCGLPFYVNLKNDLAAPPDVTTEAITATLVGSAHVAEGQNTPRQWAPLQIAVFELPALGLVLSSVLAALNWHRLRPRLEQVFTQATPHSSHDN